LQWKIEIFTKKSKFSIFWKIKGRNNLKGLPFLFFITRRERSVERRRREEKEKGEGQTLNLPLFFPNPPPNPVQMEEKK
jgi:hypothetical protein